MAEGHSNKSSYSVEIEKIEITGILVNVGNGWLGNVQRRDSNREKVQFIDADQIKLTKSWY